jgi:hypothetical protein
MKLEKVRADIVNNKNGFLNFYSGGKLKVDECEGPRQKRALRPGLPRKNDGMNKESNPRDEDGGDCVIT